MATQAIKFTVSGSWTCPPGVTNILVSGCGGGGGHAPVRTRRINVQPGQTYTITIGSSHTTLSLGITILIRFVTASFASVGEEYIVIHDNGTLVGGSGQLTISYRA
jgi:hypothetical protein